LFADDRFDVHLVVGGSHLSSRHGDTVAEIEKDGWPIAARIPFLEEGDDAVSYGQSCGKALAAYTELFAGMEPQIIVAYGDRLELLPIVSAAVVTRTPVAHLCGGDVTEGAIDDQVRHAVTKLAHLHFPSTMRSAQRILQMGEEPWRIHHVGDTAVDHFVRGEHASLEELTRDLGFAPDRRTLLVTFHPVTLELERMPLQVKELSASLSAYHGPVVITAPAPDPGGDMIRHELQALAKARPETVFVGNLGRRRYNGLLRCAGAMVGNSSSGLNEAPCVSLPVVNVGSRQQGRERAANVLDVPPEQNAILKGISTALSVDFRNSLNGLQNPYGDGHAASRIISVLASLPEREHLLRKRFQTI
jgi:UDP-hydrolysing UDP-N-acetyl-D-glucosamine 2-epimerase